MFKSIINLRGVDKILEPRFSGYESMNNKSNLAFGARKIPLTASANLIILLVFAFCFLPTAQAQTMSNSSFIIKMGNLNMGAGKPAGPSNKVSLTLGQIGPGLYSGTNFKVRAGFQYIYSIVPFSFKISPILFIDFGTIIPGTPVLRSNSLTVSSGAGHGYQVTVSENHPLKVNASGQMIPDTSCDGGTCTATSAQIWNNPGTFGFGYNCQNISGTDCSSDFLGSTYYRPFAASPSAVVVMSSPNVGRNRQTLIVYKVNISNLQAAGLYTNVLNYIATPTF